MFSSKRGNVRELFGGQPLRNDSPHQPRAQLQLRQEEYAAELRAQIASKEQRRHMERQHSLRQSVALLSLRQAAQSAVLPAGGEGGPSLAAGPQGTLPHQEEAGWAVQGPPHWRPSAGNPHTLLEPHQSLPPPEARWGGSPTQRPGPPSPSGGSWHQAGAPTAQRFPAGTPAGYPPAMSGSPGFRPRHAHSSQQSALTPPYGVLPDSPARAQQQQGAGLPPWPPVASRAPFGNDLQPQEPPAPPLGRSHSLRPANSSPPWAVLPGGAGAGQGSHAPAAARAGPGVTPASSGGGGWVVGLGAQGGDNQGDREAGAHKRAALKADLEQQLRLKDERRRKERAAELEEEAHKAQEAALMQQKAAAGGYGGGSGPLRTPSGRVIADLNEVRRLQQAAKGETVMLAAGAGGSPGRPTHQDYHQQAPPSSTAGTLPAVARGASIGAYWGPDDGGAVVGSHQPPQQLHGQQLPGSHLPQPSAPTATAAATATATATAPCGWPGAPSAYQPGRADAPPHPPILPPIAANRTSLGTPVAPGTEQVCLRMRSDRPFETPSEAQRRAAAQRDFQAALRQQIEEKARLKQEEERRRQAEEAEEEARLAREQEALRRQFEADQAARKAKQAAKEDGGTETLESGGITIKFKPPPGAGGRRAAQKQQQQQPTQRQLQQPDTEVPRGRKGSHAPGPALAAITEGQTCSHDAASLHAPHELPGAAVQTASSAAAVGEGRGMFSQPDAFSGGLVQPPHWGPPPLMQMQAPGWCAPPAPQHAPHAHFQAAAAPAAMPGGAPRDQSPPPHWGLLPPLAPGLPHLHLHQLPPPPLPPWLAPPGMPPPPPHPFSLYQPPHPYSMFDAPAQTPAPWAGQPSEQGGASFLLPGHGAAVFETITMLSMHDSQCAEAH